MYSKLTHNGRITLTTCTSFNPSAVLVFIERGSLRAPLRKRTPPMRLYKWSCLREGCHCEARLPDAEDRRSRPDPNNPIQNVLPGGNQRVDGVQFDVNGRFIIAGRYFRSYAYLDGKVVKSQYYPASVGGPLANVPAEHIQCLDDIRFPPRAPDRSRSKLCRRSRRQLDCTNPSRTRLLKEVPGYWVFNAMARYPLTERVSIQANAYRVKSRRTVTITIKSIPDILCQYQAVADDGPSIQVLIFRKQRTQCYCLYPFPV